MQNVFAQVNTLDFVEMELKPQTCVSLHEGQQCFAKVTINWQTNTVNDYCLYSTQTVEPVMCWEKVNQGTVKFDLNTKNNVDFMLAQTPNTRFMLTQTPYKIVAEAKFSVSWVYKKKKKSRLSWRLF